MFYNAIIYVLLIIISAVLILVKSDFSLSLMSLTYFLFIIVTLPLCIKNIKSLSFDYKKLSLVILYAPVYNIVCLAEKYGINEMGSHILNTIFIIVASFTGTWLIFKIIGKFSTFLVTFDPIIPASFLCIVGFKYFIVLFLLYMFISAWAIIPNYLIKTYKTNKTGFYYLVGGILGIIVLFILNYIQKGSGIYIIFVRFAILFLICFSIYKYLKTVEKKEPNEYNYMPIIPYFTFAVLIIMLYLK